MSDFMTIAKFADMYNTHQSLIYSRRKQDKRFQNKKAFKKERGRLFISPSYFINRRERERKITDKTIADFYWLTESFLPFHLAHILAATINLNPLAANQYLSLDMFKRNEKSLVNLQFSSNMVKCYIGFARIRRAIKVVGYDKDMLIKYFEMRK